jgi:DNA-directed RNA polymerase specialized sigma24 family protein
MTQASKSGSRAKVRPTLNLKLQLNEAVPLEQASADKRMTFYVRASRYRRLLHSVAHRVLGNPDRADIAVENCLFSASHRVTVFDCEGAFRSWLVRIAIDEALAILHGTSSSLLPKQVFGIDERDVCESKEAENVEQMQNRATDRRDTRLEYLRSSSVLHL